MGIRHLVNVETSRVYISALPGSLAKCFLWPWGDHHQPQASQFTATGMHRRHLLLSLLICSFFPSSSRKWVWNLGQDKKEEKTRWVKYQSCVLACCALCAQSCPTLATPWSITCQAPLFMGFPTQEYWSGLPSPPPGNLPNPGIGPMSPASLHWQAHHRKLTQFPKMQ